MTTSLQPSGRSAVAASASLWSVSVTAMLAAVTHAYLFGAAALVVGVIVIAVLFVLSGRYRRTGSKSALLLYGLLNLWIIGAFGLVGGLWNHTVKLAASVVNGGALPSAWLRWFMSPDRGSAAYETMGILMFVASMLAAYSGYRLVRTVRWNARADLPHQGPARPSPASGVERVIPVARER